MNDWFKPTAITLVCCCVVLVGVILWRAPAKGQTSEFRADVVALKLVILGADGQNDNSIAGLDALYASCGWRSFPELPRIVSKYQELRAHRYRPTYSKERLQATTGEAKNILCSAGQGLIDNLAKAISDPNL